MADSVPTGLPIKKKGLYSFKATKKSLLLFFSRKITPTMNACWIKHVPICCLCFTASEDTTAIYSEIMMYVLLVFLTFWLLVEMVYCYRKISKSDDQAQDTAWVSLNCIYRSSLMKSCNWTAKWNSVLTLFKCVCRFKWFLFKTYESMRV